MSYNIEYEARQLLFAEAAGMDKLEKAPNRVTMPERALAALWISRYYAMVLPRGAVVDAPLLMTDLHSVFSDVFRGVGSRWYDKFTDDSKDLRFDDPQSFHAQFLALINELIVLRRNGDTDQ